MFSLNNLMTSRMRGRRDGMDSDSDLQALGEEIYSRGKH